MKLADIKTPLLPHQQRVVDKIQRPDQPGLVVAHSLGSGKTLTALAAQDALGLNATAVMPAALRANYRKEMAKHQEGVSPTTDIESLQGAALAGETTPNALLIADEAHRVREPSTKAYKALAANDATKRLLLTGTPFYNHPADIAPLINLASGQRVMPTQRGEFEKKYVRDRLVAPGFLKSLRGVKPGVVTELNPMSKRELAAHLAKWVDYYPGSKAGYPGTTEENIEVPMDAEQLKVYDTMMRKAPYWVAAKVKAGLPPSKSESKDLNAFLGAVRQVSNTTGGFGGKTVHSPKIQRAYEELEKEMASNPEARAVIYSNFLESGVHPYRQLLQAHHVPFGEFTGEMKHNERDQMVRDYNEGKLKALLLSSAGGEGLDLKRTSLMQLLDPHWNATRGDQVIGRGVRYQSHEGMPEEAQNVRIQRFLATRPRAGMLERAHLKDPGMGVDQYLTQMSVDKERLNSQFRALLEEQNKREISEAAVKEQEGLKAASMVTRPNRRSGSVLKDLTQKKWRLLYDSGEEVGVHKLPARPSYAQPLRAGSHATPWGATEGHQHAEPDALGRIHVRATLPEALAELRKVHAGKSNLKTAAAAIKSNDRMPSATKKNVAVLMGKIEEMKPEDRDRAKELSTKVGPAEMFTLLHSIRRWYAGQTMGRKLLEHRDTLKTVMQLEPEDAVGSYRGFRVPKTSPLAASVVGQKLTLPVTRNKGLSSWSATIEPTHRFSGAGKNQTGLIVRLESAKGVTPLLAPPTHSSDWFNRLYSKAIGDRYRMTEGEYLLHAPEVDVSVVQVKGGRKPLSKQP